MVLYFTGTGNSKFVATVIAAQLQDTLICVNEYIKQGKQGVFHSDKPWVFVFPTYISTIPEIFTGFIKKAEITGTKDAYFVGTCASSLGASANTAYRLCKKKGLIYKGTARIVMPQSYIALFKMTEADEIERRVANALVAAKEVAATVEQGGTLDSNCVLKFRYVAARAVEKLYYGPFTQTKKFWASDMCVGCGICEKSCPLNRIEMVGGKPKWHGSCLHCMNCINRCPKQAIEYGNNTAGKLRHICREYK